MTNAVPSQMTECTVTVTAQCSMIQDLPQAPQLCNCTTTRTICSLRSQGGLTNCRRLICLVLSIIPNRLTLISALCCCPYLSSMRSSPGLSSTPDLSAWHVAFAPDHLLCTLLIRCDDGACLACCCQLPDLLLLCCECAAPVCLLGVQHTTPLRGVKVGVTVPAGPGQTQQHTNDQSMI